MTISLQAFAQRVSDELETGSVKSLDPYDCEIPLVEWNSLNMLIIASLVKEEFGVMLNSKQIRSCDSIASLYELALNSAGQPSQ